MRTNPFAPDVPCHRVLAADGGLGGYKGEWERPSAKSRAKIGPGIAKTRGEKIGLLKSEGVVFDESAGRAKGVCFGEFEELDA